jgi:hypothetical protein
MNKVRYGYGFKMHKDKPIGKTLVVNLHTKENCLKYKSDYKKRGWCTDIVKIPYPPEKTYEEKMEIKRLGKFISNIMK